MNQTQFKLSRLLALASVMFNTKTGEYITWEPENDSDDTKVWEFYSNGTYLFTLEESHLVTHTEGKEFILYESENECWFVRPFYEVDVADYLLAYGTADYSDEDCAKTFDNLHYELQGVVNDAAIF